jgi:hypothetical protein
MLEAAGMRGYRMDIVGMGRERNRRGDEMTLYR